MASASGSQGNQPGSLQMQYIAFTIGHELYGISINSVQEVIRYTEIKRLPHSPDFLLGVLNLRGNIIPIVGLREKFHLEKINYDETTRIIVVNHKSKLIGLVVDEVSRVLNIPDENIETNPEMLNDRTKALISGVARVENEVVILLELENILFSVDELELAN